jgi:NhaA family Na+:H+ antiporter
LNSGFSSSRPDRGNIALDTPERKATLLLLVATAIAVVLANTTSAYESFFTYEIISTFEIRDAINELLMALFFLVVTIEIRHELRQGELSTPRRAALPIAAAIGGMIVPAIIYLLFNAHTPFERAWGVPMATDIAFTLGLMQLLGRRIPPSLLIFVAALAIADDLGAVVVIAIFYNHAVDPVMIVFAAMVAVVIYIQTRRWQSAAVTIILSLVLWWLIRSSGIHATIAAVIIGFLLPSRTGVQDPVADKLKEPVDWIVLPLFALANAGVSLRLTNDFSLPVFFGASLGLLLGKPIGVLLFSWVTVRAQLAQLPSEVTWRMLGGAAVLCGIGFTMSLFIADLALSGDGSAYSSAKIGILGGSLVAGIAGLWLTRSAARAPRT